MKKFDWNEETIARLKTEWLAGKTCSQIAAILGGGITRNAVIGKVHRLNLGRREALNVQPRSPRTRPTEARPKPAEPVQVPNGSFMLSSPMRRNAAAVRPPTPVLAPIQIKVRKVAKGKPCGIVDVTGCKWAVGYDHKTIGGHVFCNAAKGVEKSYCDEHEGRVSAGKPAPKERARGVWR